MPDACLLPEHLAFKCSTPSLLALDVSLEFLDLDADLIEPLLILDVLLVQHRVVMLQVLVLLRLEHTLLLQLRDTLLQSLDVTAEVSTILS